MELQIRQRILVGVVATLTMDLLTALSLWLGLVAPLKPALIGRWFAAVARAEPVQADVARLPALRFEVPLALCGHYLIGIALAFAFLALASRLALPARRFDVALGFGLCSNALPWLVMFPAMGYGLFGAHGPAGTRLFVSSLIGHACYGFGLWLGARLFT